MIKALDFLVDNYMYVAGISGFFIVVLIGFLSKENKKAKKGVSKETKEHVTEVVPVVEEKPVIEQQIVESKEEVGPNIEDTEKEGFENISNNKEVETLGLVEHVVLDKERLDYEVDIIDFTDLNKFQHTGEVAKPKE